MYRKIYSHANSIRVMMMMMMMMSKKNLNASKPSEHPPSGGKYLKV